MIELQGKYNSVKVFTDNIEQEAISQIIELCNQEFVKDAKVRIMPDTHAGKGCVIGFTADLGDKIIPNLIGVDIGCFSGDTKIPLLNGSQKTLKELYEENNEFWVYSINENKMIVPAKANCIQTRKNSELIMVEISGGEKIYCTPDHKFMLRSGLYKEAKDLIYKDSLMPLYRTYQSRDGYEHVSNRGGKSQLTHKLVSEYTYGECPKGYIAHHKNENQFDNTPENLEYITKNEHSRLHGKKTGAKRFRSEKFKIDRLNTLKENGFYGEEFIEKKKEVAVNNITNYMNGNPDKFKEDIKDNGIRGKEYLIKYNQSEKGKEKSKEISNRLYICDICGEEIKSPIGLYNHKKKEHNNHKVIRVEFINRKEDVYCLNVDKYHNFALSAGVFVHNCGMEVIKLDNINIDLSELDKIINKFVPSGNNVHEGKRVNFNKLQELHCYRELKDTKRIIRSIGTLGGGNHFIEVNQDSNNNKYLVIHSGSRNLGKQVADYYQNLAIELCSGKEDFYKEKDELIKNYKEQGKKDLIQKELKKLKSKYEKLQPHYPNHLCFLTGEYREKYLHDMRICQEYATLNREIIANLILGAYFGAKIVDFESFQTIHNYINFKDNIIRKGSISAYQGEELIIPINMRDGSIIAIGKGNSDWNNSAPHGAGRLMSRSKAKNTLNMDDFKESMNGIYTTSVCDSTLDEAPMAYKPMNEIIDNIQDTVEIVEIIKPIYNFKAK